MLTFCVCQDEYVAAAAAVLEGAEAGAAQRAAAADGTAGPTVASDDTRWKHGSASLVDSCMQYHQMGPG